MARSATVKRCFGKLVEVLYTQLLVAIFASACFTIYRSTQVINSETPPLDHASAVQRQVSSLSAEARLRQEALNRLAKEAAQYEDDDFARKAPKKGSTTTKKKVPSSLTAPPPKTKGSTTTQKEGEPEKKAAVPEDDLLVQPDDFVYQKMPGESAPIVVEKYKLIFFAQAKVGCTVWKLLFRRMEGFEDWRETTLGMPHTPERNGLKYLYHYNRTYASHIMTSSHWTRAIFVRDPTERFLSAYLDKAVEEMLFVDTCCNRKRQIHCDITPPTMTEFLKAIHTCRDSHWDPQVTRVEPKYWPHVNFVGHLETAHDDARRLLTKLGVWEQFGLTGWGTNGDQSMFSSEDGLRHSNNAKSKVNEYIYPELQQKVKAFYEADYKNKLFNFKEQSTSSTKAATSTKRPFVEPRDWVYRKPKKQGEAAPVVIEKYKLVFFVVPHVADFEFKQLFRRMMGLENWRKRNHRRQNWQDSNQGLKFLYNYNLTYSSHIMTSPDWTRAIFTRDPKERFAQTYTQTAVGYRALLHGLCCFKMPRWFCKKGANPSPLAKQEPTIPTPATFLEGSRICKSTNWDPMTERLAATYRVGLSLAQKNAFDPDYYKKSKYWKHLNFIGSMDSAASHAKRLLEQVGAWKEFGETGWADEDDESAPERDSFFTWKSFQKEELQLKKKISSVIASPELERQVEEAYESDYKNPYFKLTKKFIYSLEGKTFREEVQVLEEQQKASKTVIKREW